MNFKENQKFVSYLRTSTGRQVYSIESQREIVKNFVGKHEIVKEFVEMGSSGAKHDRKGLRDAINFSKANGYTIVISRLDRLSRSVLHLTKLLEEEKVDFVTCDGIVDTFSLHIHIALAQKELELIQSRIKAGLRQAVKNGKTLGSPSNLRPEHKAKGRKQMIENAFYNENNMKAGNLIVLLRKDKMPYAKIADYLNLNNYRTRKNKLFASSTVYINPKVPSCINRKVSSLE